MILLLWVVAQLELEVVAVRLQLAGYWLGELLGYWLVELVVYRSGELVWVVKRFLLGWV